MYVTALKTAGKLLLILAALAVSLVVAAIIYSAVLYPMYLESQARLGMDRQEVLSNLKDKDYRLSEDLAFCANGAWFGDCEAANDSDSIEFLILKVGIDTWLVVGFNDQDKVSFVDTGDT